ncbi:MAG: ADP-glyceromanno-heptose 6-epimerase [Acetobacteraceae bacterium]|nr:ADP-glyceromanno-heptose 6-epimerase [Acetobacteraceae bacterium]
MILLTGGAGFIGSNLLGALAGEGAEVAIVDRLRDGGKWRNIARHLLAEIVSPDEIWDFIGTEPPIEAVVHLGAISATTATDADLVARTNLSLSQRLWEWCADADIRFAYASSAATYGDGSAGFDDEFSAAALSRLRPLNLYGWSKHAFDRWVERQVSAGRRCPPAWLGLKFFNVYGPNEYHKGPMISVVKHKYDELLAGRPARLFRSDRPGLADGEQRRDFIWVGDCVRALCWWLDQAAPPSGLFNLGTGRAGSYRALVSALARAMQVEDRVEWIDMPLNLRGQYQSFTEARMDRLRAAGFADPATPLADGIAQYVRVLASGDPFV